MFRIFRFLGGVLLVVAVSGLFGAAGTAAGTEGGERAASCYVVADANGVKVRSGASTAAAPVGQLNAGDSLWADCWATQGGGYAACGASSNLWVGVAYGGGAKKYVALMCVSWYEY